MTVRNKHAVDIEVNVKAKNGTVTGKKTVSVNRRGVDPLQLMLMGKGPLHRKPQKYAAAPKRGRHSRD